MANVRVPCKVASFGGFVTRGLWAFGKLAQIKVKSVGIGSADEFNQPLHHPFHTVDVVHPDQFGSAKIAITGMADKQRVRDMVESW